MIYVHWHHIWNRFLLVFPSVRNRASSWSQPFLCPPGCELSGEPKYLHPTTLPVGTAPGTRALRPRTQSSHPGRDSKVASARSLETPRGTGGGKRLARRQQVACTSPGHFLHCPCYLFLAERLS